MRRGKYWAEFGAAATDRTWLLTHQVVAGRVDAEGQCRWSIGDQVDPQDLRGEKWQDNGAALGLQADAISQQDRGPPRRGQMELGPGGSVPAVWTRGK